MAELSFHYLPAGGQLQKLDARIKLLAVFCLSIVTFPSKAPGLLFVTVFLIVCMILARIRIAVALKELRLFLLFAVLIVAASTIQYSPATDTLPVSLISTSGLMKGLIVAWRFLDLIILGVIFTAATSVTEIRNGAESILSFIPGIDGRKLAFMVGATVSMLPLISDAVEETRMAQQARCAHRRRNPIVRIVKLSLPLLLRVFRMTDEMAQAMQARGLDFDRMRERRKIPFQKSDYVALFITTLICVGAFSLELIV